MLYVFFGNDRAGARKAAREFIGDTLKHTGEVIEIGDETFVPGTLTELAGGVSLFGGSGVIVLDGLGAVPEYQDELLDSVLLLKDSPNTFIIIEGTLLTDAKKMFTKHAENISEIKKETEKRFNSFALADALCARDKKSLWLLLIDARRNGISDEEIIGTLFWQVKIMRLAERTKSANESGQKDFVYNKAKRALQKFRHGEADSLSKELLSLYHEGHSGKRDLALALERWVLAL